jgi:hypothetical protein
MESRSLAPMQQTCSLSDRYATGQVSENLQAYPKQVGRERNSGKLNESFIFALGLQFS